MKCRPFLFLVLSLAILHPCWVSAQQSAYDYDIQGNAHASKGDQDGAIIAYTQAIALDSKDAVAYFNRGNSKLAKNDLTGAITDYDKAISLDDPKVADVYVSRGIAKEDKGDLEGAIADYDRAIRIEPKYKLGYYNRGEARQDEGNIGGAISDYDCLIALDPNFASGYFNRGNARQVRGDFDGAAADYTRALELGEKYADYCHFYLWIVRSQKGSDADANQDLKNYLNGRSSSSPEDWPAKIGNFLIGKMHESDFLAAASSKDTNIDRTQHCEAWYYVGLKRLLGGDKPQAEHYFRKCLATNLTDYQEYSLAHAELVKLEQSR